jgi:hypothetical protein
MTGNRLSIYSPGGGADSASKSATAIFFADFAKTMLDKKNTLSQEDWSRLADMKIATFKNTPKIEDDGISDRDIWGWLDDKESVDEIEAALCNAGREDEITPFRRSFLGRFGNAEWMAEALFADGQTKEAEEWFEKHLEKGRVSKTTQARMRGFAISRGDLIKAAAFDAEAFFDNPSVDGYDQLMAICSVGSVADAVRKAVFRALESGIRPDFEDPKAADWPLPIVALGRCIVEEPTPSHGAFRPHRRRAQGARLQVPRLGDRLCVHAVRRPRQRPRPLLLPLQGTRSSMCGKSLNVVEYRCSQEEATEEDMMKTPREAQS